MITVGCSWHSTSEAFPRFALGFRVEPDSVVTLRLSCLFAFLCSGSARGSPSWPPLSFCFCVGLTFGWSLKMISTSSTGECATLFYFCKSKLESQGQVSVSTGVTDSRLPSPGWCTIAPGNGGMRRCPSLHLQLWDSPTLLSWWWRSFSDPSKIMWPTTYMTSNRIFFFLLCQILALFHISLGQQLNLYWVHKVQWVAQVLHVPVTPDESWHPLCLFCPGRLECWLRCWPLSPALSLLMTYGAVSGTSYWYHCRFDEFKVFWNYLDDDLGENSLPDKNCC